MSEECIICNKKTIMFIWSTSRNILINRLENIIKFSFGKSYPICLNCCKEFNLLIDRPKLILDKPKVYITWKDMNKSRVRK